MLAHVIGISLVRGHDEHSLKLGNQDVQGQPSPRLLQAGHIATVAVKCQERVANLRGHVTPSCSGDKLVVQPT